MGFAFPLILMTFIDWNLSTVYLYTETIQPFPINHKDPQENFITGLSENPQTLRRSSITSTLPKFTHLSQKNLNLTTWRITIHLFTITTSTQYICVYLYFQMLIFTEGKEKVFLFFFIICFEKLPEGLEDGNRGHYWWWCF